jgi:hypothetical protein
MMTPHCCAWLSHFASFDAPPSTQNPPQPWHPVPFGGGVASYSGNFGSGGGRAFKFPAYGRAAASEWVQTVGVWHRLAAVVRDFRIFGQEGHHDSCSIFILRKAIQRPSSNRGPAAYGEVGTSWPPSPSLLSAPDNRSAGRRSSKTSRRDGSERRPRRKRRRT